MPMSERDISILRHIISYCEDIESSQQIRTLLGISGPIEK